VTSHRRGEETRERILQAALERFSQNGYEATGVAEICRAAKVTKGGFYHHFSSKQQLFLELLEHWLSVLDEGIELLREDASTVPEAILSMSATVGQVFSEASGQLPMFLEFWNMAARDGQVWQATIAPYRRYHQYFTDLLQEGIDEGTLRPSDPRIGAQVIVSLAVGLMLQGLLDPSGADWAQVTHDSILMVLNSMRQEVD